MKKTILFILFIQILTGCTTLTPVDPVKPVEKMSTYDLQNEYLDLEHKIKELESEFNNLQTSANFNTNFQFYDNSAVWIVLALNVLNAYNANNLVTKIEQYKIRLSEIENELTRRDMY